jgi:activator of HSP90 ATPase
MTVKNLRQTTTLAATPHEVFELLVDPELHAMFTGASAELDRKVGGAFAHYDGALRGFVLDLKKDARIVLAWRSTDWGEGQYSIAQFNLKKVKAGTRLEFLQCGIPSSDFADISEGWRQYYWRPMKAYLEA